MGLPQASTGVGAAALAVRRSRAMDSGFVSRSHRAISPFVLSRPDDVETAASHIRTGALAHAGGVDVVARLQAGATAREVVHLGGIEELSVLDLDGDVIRIGSMVTHHRMENDELLRSVRPDLAAAWATVGNVRIRRTGTVGGNVLARDASYDAAPLLAAVGASMMWACLLYTSPSPRDPE